MPRNLRTTEELPAGGLRVKENFWSVCTSKLALLEGVVDAVALTSNLGDIQMQGICPAPYYTSNDRWNFGPISEPRV